jgi:ABC-type branched-subunit amino acid transport system substrate-binding protein
MEADSIFFARQATGSSKKRKSRKSSLPLFFLFVIVPLTIGLLSPPHVFSQTPSAPLPAKLEEQAKNQIESAIKLKEAGKLEPAIELLQKLVADLPQSVQVPQAYLLVGQMLAELKNHDEAGGYYRRLLEEYPESALIPQARLGLIGALLATGQLNAALPLLLEAKDQSADPVEKLATLKQLEEAAFGTQDYMQAVEAAVEAGPLSPEDERKQSEERVRDLLKTKFAEKDLRRLADKHPRAFPADAAVLRLLVLHEAAGEDHKAARVARDFLAQFPQHERAAAIAAAQAARRATLKSKAVRLGALLPLSGQLTPYGTEVLHGILIALEVAAETSPSLSVGLVTKDTESDPRQLTRELEDLLKDYQPIAVIGPLLSREVKAVAQAAEAYEVVFVTPTATVPDVQKFGRYLFNAAVNNRALVRDLAAYATGPLGWKRFCILAASDAYGTEMAQAFTEEIRRLGGEIIAAEAYAPEENDFGPPIKRIKEADLKKYGKLEKIETPKKGKDGTIYQPGFDAIFLPGDAEKVSLLAGQVGFYAAKVGVLGTNGMNSPELLRLDARGVEGAVFADSFSVDSPDPIVRNFVERYKKRFQAPPTAFAAQAYEATRLVVDAILKGATTGRALRESVKNARNVPGLVGPLTMSPAGHLERHYTLIQVKNGRFASVMDAR